MSGPEIHEAVFTRPRGFQAGLYCSCGWVWGMGNRLGAERAFDNHVLAGMGVGKLHV